MASYPPIPPAPPPYGPPSFGPPPYGYGPMRSTNGKAIAALVCSLAAFVVCPLTSVAAVILAPQAKREIAAEPDRYDGVGLAVAGQIIGWIGIAGLILSVIGFILFFTLLATTSTTSYESLGALVI